MARRPPSATKRAVRTMIGVLSFVGLAGCTVLLGFDKEVFEQGRSPVGDEDDREDGSAVSPAAGDASAADASGVETALRGVPDPTFGDAGVTEIGAQLLWSVDNPAGVTERCRAIQDTSGRIVVACATDATSPDHPETRVFRLSSGGALDTTFGAKDGGGLSVPDYVPEIAARSGDALLLAGYKRGSAPSPSTSSTPKSIARALTATGAPDTSFGDAGVLDLALTGAGDDDAITALAPQGDTVTMIASLTTRDNGTYRWGGSAWLELDPSTAKITRRVDTRAPAFKGDFASGALRPSKDRTVLVGAAVTTQYNPSHVSLTAYSGDQLDPTFGDGGRTLVRLVQEDVSLLTVGLLERSAERYLVTASTRRSTGSALVRLSADGLLDPTFGDGGAAPLPVAPFDPTPRVDVHTALLASDGKVVAGGALVFGDNSQRPFILRMTATGELDTTFGKNGWITPNFGPTATDGKITQLLFTPNGRLVAVGTAVMNLVSRNIFVARYR